MWTALNDAHQRRRWLLTLSLTALLGVGAGAGLMHSRSVQAQAPAAAGTPAPELVRGLPDFSILAEQVGPSVVNIRTTAKVRTPSAADNGADEQMQEFFRRFFGVPMPQTPSPRNRPQPREESQPRGLGSGFILTPDGFVMTNAHVIEGADEVLVTLTDKREFKARVVGADKRTDVAVVKIEATGLPAVRIADVSRLKVGEWVMAIGSPFGLESTVTAGIVSAKQRDTGDYLPFIQTDVAINPGNSGGPLLNLRGEVVGINSQIYSRSGGFMGISFAIPIDEAMRVSDQLRANGKVTRGRIGVQIGTVTKEIAESAGLDKARGVLIGRVEEGAPADKAGIEPGDILLKFDNKVIETPSDLPRQVGNTAPGKRVPVTVWRRGAERTLQVTVAATEADTVVAGERERERERKSEATAAGPLGLTVADLSADEKRELRLQLGVRVTAATEAAARAGIREGDILVALGNQEIASVADFRAISARLPKGQAVGALIRRGPNAVYVLIRPTP